MNKRKTKTVTLEEDEFEAFWNITNEALKIIERKRERGRQKNLGGKEK